MQLINEISLVADSACSDISFFFVNQTNDIFIAKLMFHLLLETESEHQI